MAESDYHQFLFQQHDPKKFYKYEEIKNHKGFRLPNEKKKSTIYLQDDDGGWCDLNGCYYNSEGQPNGWIILSKDGKKYMKFNMNAELIQENQNIYYSNNSYDAAISEQYQKQYKKNHEQELKQQQNEKEQPQKEFKKQQNQNQDLIKKQENKNDEQKAIDYEKVRNEEKINQKGDPKNDQTEKRQKQREKKKEKNNKNKKKEGENQNNSESNKYYILNINENTLSKDQFLKYLIEEYKIKEKDILEYNEENVKLAQEKDAITLYRLNQKEQANKVQKFIAT